MNKVKGGFQHVFERGIKNFGGNPLFRRASNGNPVDELRKSSETGKQLWEDTDTNITLKNPSFHLRSVMQVVRLPLFLFFPRLEVYLSNQEYSNLAAACFEPISFMFRCFFFF